MSQYDQPVSFEMCRRMYWIPCRRKESKSTKISQKFSWWPMQGLRGKSWRSHPRCFSKVASSTPKLKSVKENEVGARRATESAALHAPCWSSKGFTSAQSRPSRGPTTVSTGELTHIHKIDPEIMGFLPVPSRSSRRSSVMIVPLPSGWTHQDRDDHSGLKENR